MKLDEAKHREPLFYQKGGSSQQLMLPKLLS
jgi:hypothetical protein